MINSFINYKLPSFKSKAFTCPHCGIYASFNWLNISTDKAIDSAECSACSRITIWHGGELIFPSGGKFILPHPLVKGRVLHYFENARNIALINMSVACSFLRKAIQQLFIELGCKGQNSDDDVEFLIDSKIGDRKFFNMFRSAKVFGHDKIMPLVIDESDDEAMVELLVYLINKLVETAIAEPIYLTKLMAKLTNKEQEELKRGANIPPIANPDFYNK